MRQLDPQDATFLYLEAPNRGTHATFVWVYDPVEAPDRTIVFGDLVKHVESRLHVAKLLYQKLVRVPFSLDYPYWEDDGKFEIANHLHELTLPEPGDWATFCRVVSEVHSRPLDLDRPLWEIHLVRGLEAEGLPDNAFAVLMKLHHVALDGATGMALVQGLHDLEPTPLSRPSRRWKTPTSERAPAPLEMLVAAARNNLVFARKGVRAAVQLAGRLPHVLSTVRLNSLRNALDAPESLFNQDVAAERSFGLAVADLEQIKQIRHAVPGATVNDVLLTICGGALRRFLEAKGALPASSMVSVCPINVRTADEADRAGNRIAVMTARIHTDIADPLERLKAVHRSTRKSKGVVDSIGAREMLELNNTVPSPVQALAIGLANRLPRAKAIPRFFNLSISNLPGPQGTLYLGGARLLQVGGSMPVGNGYGLFIAICSYDGKVSFSVSSARNILPDPEQLMVHFPHALAELRQAVASDGAPPRKALAPVLSQRTKEAR